MAAPAVAAAMPGDDEALTYPICMGDGQIPIRIGTVLIW